MIIKTISSIVPGYRGNGKPFGALVATDTILKHIGNADEQALDIFDTAFIREKIGIHHVALTSDTIECMKVLWDHRSDWTPAQAFAFSQHQFNRVLYDMLAVAIDDCLDQMKQKHTPDGTMHISHHIHLTGIMHPFIEDALFRVREKSGIRLTQTCNTIVIQQGCTSLLTALRLSETLLKGNIVPGAHILITAENNMISNTHTLAPGKAKRENINEWIYSSIFGEAVAACLVSDQQAGDDVPECSGPSGWEVTALRENVLLEDWRLKYVYSAERADTYMHVRAREVPDTYYLGITKALAAAVQLSGGLDHIFRICLHESNPGLLIRVADGAGIPHEMIPSTCAEIGTLAGVSSFLLLDIVNREFLRLRAEGKEVDDKVVMASVGEGYSKMLSGYVCLTAL
ncbi:hypothetical protein HF324_06925 [Chitinophaga oryzae]|uniref:Uncharacterized protein n=1 Tax=Chitinophaga oryzae TaxID=2725414 RepID=A0ABX6LFC6_9BACT|nr:hypothetical protein [Chitinophaga oryzae]QJB37596.1 hypothetical protein HF324_06925 [Chitinophaga oryzae]